MNKLIILIFLKGIGTAAVINKISNIPSNTSISPPSNDSSDKQNKISKQPSQLDSLTNTNSILHDIQSKHNPISPGRLTGRTHSDSDLPGLISDNLSSGLIFMRIINFEI